jgi:hypothetical protein
VIEPRCRAQISASDDGSTPRRGIVEPPWNAEDFGLFGACTGCRYCAVKSMSTSAGGDLRSQISSSPFSCAIAACRRRRRRPRPRRAVASAGLRMIASILHETPANRSPAPGQRHVPVSRAPVVGKGSIRDASGRTARGAAACRRRRARRNWYAW